MSDKSYDDMASISAQASNKKLISSGDLPTGELTYFTRSVRPDQTGTITYVPIGAEGDASVTETFAGGIEQGLRAKEITATSLTSFVVGW